MERHRPESVIGRPRLITARHSPERPSVYCCHSVFNPLPSTTHSVDPETGCDDGVFLFGVLWLIAWASGQAFVFPSLGPSAFVLAFDRHADRGQLREIVLAHAIGCVGGFAAWTLVSPGGCHHHGAAAVLRGGVRDGL